VPTRALAPAQSRNPTPGTTRAPGVRPLSPDQAVASFANRFARTADRLRQIATKFGVRPYRVFLTWSVWSGDERGEGTETIVRRNEVLPTPRITSMDSVTFSPYHAGILPVGSVKVDRISVDAFTFDLLRGHYVPNPEEDLIPEPVDFYWEVVEDGRGDVSPIRAKFRLLNYPMRRAGAVEWTCLLERVSEDRTRDDKSAIGLGTQG
jgi:hypothetical protein